MHNSRIYELVKVFFLEGLTCFGGPSAHIALMEKDTVEHRQWLSHERFLDTFAASNLIPGPTSTQMAIHIGFIHAGTLGAILAGTSFILPAFLITLGLAWLYVNIGNIPAFVHLSRGIEPAVLVIIIEAFWRFAKKNITNSQLVLIAIVISLSVLSGLNQVLALFFGGLLGILLLFKPKANNTHPVLVVSIGNLAQPTLLKLGLFFLKIGSILFGGGYLLFAFLQRELVIQNHWLTQQELVDAIAVGQFTPGPILSTATFVGYLILGTPGAIISTLAIFLPSFILVLISNPLIPKMQQSKITKAFLDGLKSASIALIGLVAINLGYNILTVGQNFNWLTIFLVLLNSVLIFRLKVKSTWIIALGLLFGLLID